jgi:hypothetical protein
MPAAETQRLASRRGASLEEIHKFGRAGDFEGALSGCHLGPEITARELVAQS